MLDLVQVLDTQAPLNKVFLGLIKAIPLGVVVAVEALPLETVHQALTLAGEEVVELLTQHIQHL
jgi:hypothetical protein